MYYVIENMNNETISVKIIDIFGNEQSNNNNMKSDESKIKSKKIFPTIDINTGLNNNQLQSDYVLIHRLLQKKLSNDLDKNIQKFIKILINEMNSKTNKYDINIITRNTLLEYYVK